MLPAGELARLRDDMLYTMLDTCAILSVTRVNDGFGGVVESWGTTSTDVPCRMDQKTGMERTAAGGVQWFSQDVMSIPTSYTVTTAMRVQFNSTNYNILSINEGSGLAVMRLVLGRV